MPRLKKNNEGGDSRKGELPEQRYQDVERLCFQEHAGSHCGEKLMKIRLVRKSGQVAKGLKDNIRELQLHPSLRKGQQSVLFCLKQRCHNSHTKA